MNKILNKDVAFLEMKPSVIGKVNTQSSNSSDDEFVGQNPPDAAIITYYLKKRHVFGKMYLEIYNENQELVKTIPAGKRKGFNRVSWTLMKKPPKIPSSPSIAQFAMVGPFYDPGTYTVKLIKGDKTYVGKVSLILDPDSPYSKEDLEIRYKTINKGYKILEDLAYINAKATGVMKDARKTAKGTKGSVTKKLNELANQLESLHKEMVATKVGGITGEEKLREKIVFLYATSILYQGKPTNSQIDGLESLQKKMESYDTKINTLLSVQLTKINKALSRQGLEPIKIISPNDFQKQN